MPAETAAQNDRAASVAPDIRPTAPWRVQEVTALPDDRLFVRFIDGLSGIVDLSALIASPQAGVFARLRDRACSSRSMSKWGQSSGPASWILLLTRCTPRSRNMGSGGSRRSLGRRWIRQGDGTRVHLE